ncbi:quinoprotein dehydrogenase-associated SoxYZ-like carrier [Oceanicola sp. 502str15]|uniref:quinoprotein dehydrogenase-associated SoxYZ-like carrier n=1 Tax=Oceanicola sp. 502str15 TaxID=2696061 RepID=UPI0020954D7E|nr:quinoprotein dehydrogenase-associated SoxYZ-like carrier [Oceanicola sp. 502str15]MCO6382102.1 quinoprotein dehydrogenase-associated SoxYZ-like carrier [Oceanicola sp. 502str15]
MKRLLLPALLALASPALALDPSWPDLQAALYEGRALLPGDDVIAIDAPYRSADDARTRIAAQVAAPEGRQLASLTVILDENPMPVSAVFSFTEPLPRFTFEATFRVNGPTPLHMVAETTDGALWVSETFVKTSGKGACSAPPGTDPEEALATLGNMEIALSPLPSESALDRLGALAHGQKQVDIDVSHPSHSGMQMDQISLLYIPMRYVENLDVELDGGAYVDITGSISLSENPSVSLSVPRAAGHIGVTMTDTDGTTTHAERALADY